MITRIMSNSNQTITYKPVYYQLYPSTNYSRHYLQKAETEIALIAMVHNFKKKDECSKSGWNIYHLTIKISFLKLKIINEENYNKKRLPKIIFQAVFF
ncbi:hypothetical protein ACFSTE_17300 [Aquimarina hainanensis]|uniref:Transposase DDE domain-containing protein n=1 Tax=Aquimarina hainanensis TaxID=1578017 RepID=A0ABW5NBV6_9FLAO